jgi:2-dehydro-3-deoxygalactonokinase
MTVVPPPASPASPTTALPTDAPAATAARPALIGLDWGTSALRGWLFDAQGRILAGREDGPGVLAIGASAFREAFERFCGPWLAVDPSLPVIAAGMIGSRQGWREAAYLPAPAGIRALAAALLPLDDTAGRVFRIVPGMLAELPDGARDVMRGEETQVIGALLGHTAPASHGLFVLPGSHGKWVAVRGAQIVALRTSLTGEAWAALREHTILGRLCADPVPDDPDAQEAAWLAFDQGVAQIRAEPGALLHLLFRVRTEGLFGRLRPEQLPAYLSGLLTGAEVGDALRWPARGAATPVLVGSGTQMTRYARALAGFGVSCAHASPDRAAAGLWALARAAGLLAAG